MEMVMSPDDALAHPHAPHKRSVRRVPVLTFHRRSDPRRRAMNAGLILS